MITASMIQTISKRFKVNELQVKSRLRDFTDAVIEKALQRTYDSFDDLTFFLEKFQESEEVIANLRGYENSEEQNACWEKWDREVEGLK